MALSVRKVIYILVSLCAEGMLYFGNDTSDSQDWVESIKGTCNEVSVCINSEPFVIKTWLGLFLLIAQYMRGSNSIASTDKS